MKNKWILPVILIGVLALILYFVFTNISFVDEDMLDNSIDYPSNYTDNESNVKPVEDIIGTLNVYLIDKSEMILVKEARSISIKDLTNDTYMSLLKNLQKSNNKLLAPIPSECKILSANLEGNTLTIDLSEEFITQDTSNGLDKLILNSIVSTLTNLKEVSLVKINVENNTSATFGQYSLTNMFSKNTFQ